MLTKAIYSKRFCRIMQDSAWFCKIMLNSETFCMFYEKFEAYLPKILLRNYQRLKQTLPILRYGVQKLNYQRSKLPISKVTNIEVYLYKPFHSLLHLFGYEVPQNDHRWLQMVSNERFWCSPLDFRPKQNFLYQT